jgi:hypothetical protein
MMQPFHDPSDPSPGTTGDRTMRQRLFRELERHGERVVRVDMEMLEGATIIGGKLEARALGWLYLAQKEEHASARRQEIQGPGSFLDRITRLFTGR